MSEVKSYLAAADVGGTTVKLGFFTPEGELLKKWEIKTDVSDHGKNILADLCASVQKEAGEVPVAGLGICVPGAVDENSVVHTCVNLGWGIVDLKKEVGKLVPEIPVIKFGNDATVAALGELWKGAGKKYHSAYLYTLGTGVGGGYANQRGIISGAHGAAAEVGHIIINNKETVKCTCGRCGCVEQYASANGTVRTAKNLLALKNGTEFENRLHVERLFDIEIPEGPSPLDTMETFTSKDIVDLAKDGDAFAMCILDTVAKCLGLAMGHTSCAIDPEVFVIGGGMSRAGSILTDAIKKHLSVYAFPPAKDTDVIVAELGNDAGIYGCACMLLEN